MNAPKQSENFIPLAGVEVARGFIGENQRRVVDQRPGDGDALALASRDFAGKMPRPAREPDPGERHLGAGSAIASPDAPIAQGQLHVLGHAESRQQVEALEDEPDLFTAKLRQPVRVDAGDKTAVQAVGARSGMREAPQNFQQSRFARTRGPHDRHELAAADRQVDPAERVDIQLTRRVVLLDPLEGDQRVAAVPVRFHCRRTSSPSSRPLRT